MDARQVLQLLRWKESAELEMTEHVRQGPFSRQAHAMAIVVGAQLLGVRQRLIAAHAQGRQQPMVALGAE